MKATQLLHNLGQSLWLDNITRELLTSGTLKRYIDELSVTGLTSNPTIFDRALKNSSSYDAAIIKKLRRGKMAEELFFELALEDLTQAADLFRPIYDRTNGVDGWVSLEVSPLLAHDTNATLAADMSRMSTGLSALLSTPKGEIPSVPSGRHTRLVPGRERYTNPFCTVIPDSAQHTLRREAYWSSASRLWCDWTTHTSGVENEAGSSESRCRRAGTPRGEATRVARSYCMWRGF